MLSIRYLRRAAAAIARWCALSALAAGLCLAGSPARPIAADDEATTLGGQAFRAIVSGVDDFSNLTAGAELVLAAAEAFADKGQVKVRFQGEIPQPFNVDLGMSYHVPFEVSYFWDDVLGFTDQPAFVEVYVVLDNGSIKDPNAKVIHATRIPERGYFQDTHWDRDDSQSGTFRGGVWIGAKQYDPEMKPARVRVVAALFRLDGDYAWDKHDAPPYKEIPPIEGLKDWDPWGTTGAVPYWRRVGQYTDRRYEQFHHYVPGFGVDLPANMLSHCAQCDPAGTTPGAKAGAILGGLWVASQDSADLQVIVHNPFYVSQSGEDGRSDDGIFKSFTDQSYASTWWYNNFTLYSQYRFNYPSPIQVQDPEPPVANVAVSGLLPGSRWVFAPPEPASFQLPTGFTRGSRRVEWRGRWEGPRNNGPNLSSYVGSWSVTVRGTTPIWVQRQGTQGQPPRMQPFTWEAQARIGPGDQEVFPRVYRASDEYIRPR